MSAWESRGASSDWFTPAYIFDALGCRFDLDVAAPIGGPRHVPCERYLSVLSPPMRWAGFIFMNAPYGDRNGLEPWLDKFFAHGNGIALVPDRTSAPWFQRAAKQASALLFISPKIKFERPNGTIGKSPGCGTVLMSAGLCGRAALLRAGRLGFVALPNAGANETWQTKSPLCGDANNPPAAPSP